MDQAKQRFRRTRIAPTPSGYLHLGNAFSFALTAALAKRAEARVLLRIDDLDRERVKPEYVQDIFDTLDFLEIPWDEGPRNYPEYVSSYSQMHRMHRYEEALERLRKDKQVFACRCSRSDVLSRHPSGVYTGTCKHAGLPLDVAGVSWRLDVAAGAEAVLQDLNGRTSRKVLPESMHYFVVRKRDGFPAYQLASILDDEYFGVDLIVRGADLWDSTLAQNVLAQRLDLQAFQNTTFLHHELLMKDRQEKFSKSAGDTSVQYLRKQGATRASVFTQIGNMLGLPAPVASWEGLGDALLGDDGRYSFTD